MLLKHSISPACLTQFVDGPIDSIQFFDVPSTIQSLLLSSTSPASLSTPFQSSTHSLTYLTSPFPHLITHSSTISSTSAHLTPSCATCTHCTPYTSPSVQYTSDDLQSRLITLIVGSKCL